MHIIGFSLFCHKSSDHLPTLYSQYALPSTLLTKKSIRQILKYRCGAIDHDPFQDQFPHLYYEEQAFGLPWRA
jgi:hypothetical protein